MRGVESEVLLVNTADLLDRYNAWRKGDIDTWRTDSNEGPSPKDITAAIAEGAAAIRELAALRAELDRLRGEGESVAYIDDIGHIQFTDRGTLKCGDKLYTHPAPQDDARDAERYRYIRDNAKDGAVKTLLPLYRVHYFASLEPLSECPTFDAAIDAAILAANGGVK